MQNTIQNLHEQFQEGRKSRLLSVRPQNTIISAEQSAIITAIHSTIKEPRRKLIATKSLSTFVAALDKKNTKNLETRTIRKLLGQEEDNAAREALEKNLDKTETPRRT
jgi:hypothetical protein